MMKDNQWQIVGDYGNDFHAGPKAQRDVTTILSGLGFRSYFIRRCQFKGGIGKLLNRLIWFVQCQWMRHRLPENCTLFMQYPSAAWSKSKRLRLLDFVIKKKKNIKLVVLFHDLPSLRTGEKAFEDRMLANDEQDLMSFADVIIVHNESMKRVLIERGIASDKMVILGTFDYLTDNSMWADRKFEASVIVAGNLSPDKVGYLKGLPNICGVEWRLYGVNFDSAQLKGENVKYMGCYSPEELPGKMVGAFGLVWDGTDIETCAGDYGNYLRINAPHKLSLYLAAGLPVIVWAQSGQAEFVTHNGVGVVVDSLSEAAERVRRMTTDEYLQMQLHVRDVGRRMRAGEFMVRAMRDAKARLDV